MTITASGVNNRGTYELVDEAAQSIERLAYDRDGNITGYKTRTKSGPHVNFTDEDLLDPPPHLRILDLDSSGIDPYQYLDLP